MAINKKLPISEFRILSIDDNEFDQLLIKKIIQVDDVIIDTAESGLEAKKMMQLNNYALIICDIMMPETSGFDFIKIIKSDKHFKDIPIIFFSANPETDDISREAYSLGALDIISKGRSNVQLKGRINALIKQLKISHNQTTTLIENNIECGNKWKELREEESETVRKLNLDIKNAKTAYDNVSVVFSDFSNFTSISKKLGADDIISKLNFYFSKFDQIVGKYQVEKIKTIGDSYMCASGVVGQKPMSAIRAVLCALEMKDFVDSKTQEDIENGLDPWHIKFGMAQGRVVSGVVGQTKYVFDIWGDPVNIASRLEGLAKQDDILITENMKDEIGEYCELSSIGVQDLRNWGKMEVFNVTGLKKEFMATPQSNIIKTEALLKIRSIDS